MYKQMNIYIYIYTHIYNGKELSVVTHTVKHNYITSIIVIMTVLTTTCFGPLCGPSSGCKIRLDQLYYNAWKYSWEYGGWGVPWSRFFKKRDHGTPPTPLLPRIFPRIIE